VDSRIKRGLVYLEKCGLSPIETISLDKWQNDTEAKEAMFLHRYG